MISKSYVTLHRIQSIYNFIQSGKLVVPDFQRKFVWPKSSVRDLLQSIYKGYPIGNILVLEDEPGTYPALSRQESLFPIVDQDKYREHTKIWYVLDGSQRLAAIYNTFFGNKADFEFWFDLETEEFIPKGNIQNKQSYISLRSLFSSDLFLETFTKIGKSDNNNMLLDRMNQLHSAFKDYELVIQVLVGMTLDDAVEVFERLNSRGLSLSKDEIKRIREKYSGRSN
jgi:uncharacterized protein with ParB-like and HNH nuclease domain